MLGHLTAAVLGLLGLLAGEGARRLVATGRYRRPGDPAPRAFRWAPLAGAAAFDVVARGLAHRSPAVVGTGALVTGVLLVLALVDLEVHRLPDALVRPLAAGLLLADTVWAVAAHDVGPLRDGVLAGVALFAGFYLLALLPSGFGFGDVKLAGALGLALGPLGWDAVLALPVLAIMTGGLAALALLATGRAGRRTHLAFGPALAVGAVLAPALT